MASPPRHARFGIPAGLPLDSVDVTWPDGTTASFADVADARLLVIEHHPDESGWDGLYTARWAAAARSLRVEGEDAHQGPSRPEIIRSSAARGFAQRAYEEVYTDYSDHAEEVLQSDEIPQGYRFYVRRYFQLILI